MNEKKRPAGIYGTRNIFDAAYKIMVSILGWLFAIVFALTTISVVLRYFFNTSIYGVQEIIDYSFVYLSALGAAVIIYAEEHIGVDFFVKSPKLFRTILLGIKHIAVIILFAFLFILSLDWIRQVGAFETPLLHIQQRWMLYAIPVSMVIGILFSLCKLGRLLMGKKGEDTK